MHGIKTLFGKKKKSQCLVWFLGKVSIMALKYLKPKTTWGKQMDQKKSVFVSAELAAQRLRLIMFTLPLLCVSKLFARSCSLVFFSLSFNLLMM